MKRERGVGAQAPVWFKFPPGEFLHDTQCMSLDELGAHAYVMCVAWVNGGSIPASLDDLRRYPLLRSLPRKKLERVWRAISPLWIATASSPTGRLVNVRLETELSEMEQYRTAKSRAGRASAANRKARNAATYAEHVFNTADSENAVV